MESIKNTISHHVDELYRAIYGQSSNDTEVILFSEQLANTINPHVSSKLNIEGAKKLIMKQNPNAEAFIKKYNELKLRNIRELDQFVYLLAKIKSDPDLLFVLNRNDNQSTELDSTSVDKENMKWIQGLVNSHKSTFPSASYNSFETVRGEYPLADAYATFPDDAKIDDSRKKQVLRLHPDWIYNRPYLTLDYLRSELLTAKQPSVLPLETLPLNTQEKLIVLDILSCLQGNDGCYVKSLPLESSYSTRRFYIDEKMHPSLMDTVLKVLPICSNYSTIVRFTEEKSLFEYGRVNQALCEAIEHLLREYWVLICQLETQYKSNQLGISRLLFLLQETGYLFTHIARLTSNINTSECTGGAVLSLIQESLRATASLDHVHDCMTFLMRSACVPFLDTLKKWIYRGIISDPYNEFCISDASLTAQETSGDISSHDHPDIEDYFAYAYYWDQNYAIVPTQIPGFLEYHVEKILTTGKYLNLVRQCDSSVKLCDPEDIEFSEEEPRFLEQIDRAHAFASKILLHLIIQKKDLKGLLKSVKRYFLFEQGDFIVHFMDAAAGELRKPHSLVSTTRLESLLELALRTSSADSDPYKDNLRVASADCDLITQMINVFQLVADGSKTEIIKDLNPSGLETFSLDYNVEWPLNLVFNRLVMDRYQVLFRLLFYCRHVERHLAASRSLQKIARRTNTPAALWFNTAFILSQRMLTFIQHLQYYMTVEVIEPTWHQFFQYLDKADNLDDVLDAHTHLLETCMEDCLLTSPELLTLVGKINVVCVNFANFICQLSSSSLDETNQSVPMSSAACMSSRGRPLLHHPSEMSNSLFGSVKKLDYSSKSSFISSSSSDIRQKVAAFDLNCVGSQDAFSKRIQKFGADFHGLVLKLLHLIRKPNALQRGNLLSLATRLDFNGFYTISSKSLQSITPLSDFSRDHRTLGHSTSLTSLTSVEGSDFRTNLVSTGRPPTNFNPQKF